MKNNKPNLKGITEELYSACRKGKVSEVEKLHKKFVKNSGKSNGAENDGKH